MQRIHHCIKRVILIVKHISLQVKKGKNSSKNREMIYYYKRSTYIKAKTTSESLNIREIDAITQSHPQCDTVTAHLNKPIKILVMLLYQTFVQNKKCIYARR